MRLSKLLLVPVLVLAFMATPASAADGDGDGIDDAVEARLCDRQAVRDVWNTHTGGTVGRCASASDFQQSETVDDTIDAVNDALEDVAPVNGVHAVLCQLEADDREVDGRCAQGAEGLRYTPPGLANLTRGFQQIFGPAPVICHDVDTTQLVGATLNNADCDERSNADETNEALGDPQGFAAAPRCDNPVLYQNESTDCDELVDPEDFLPGDDGPYACVIGVSDPVALLEAIVNNVDCDSRSNADETNELVADPQGFASDPTKNNPAVPE